jgi:hypothetical protein
MNDSIEDRLPTAFAVACVVAAAFCVSLHAFSYGRVVGIKLMESVAVERGHGEYVEDAHGRQFFMWKETK